MPLLTSKGQVTIPKPVRELLRIKEGDSVVFEEVQGMIVLRKEERKTILNMGGIALDESKGGGGKGR